MIYEIEVRPGPDSDYFQYYTEEINAPTSHDAVSRIQRRNPGCDVRCVNYWNENERSGSSIFSSNSGETTGKFLLIALCILLWLMIQYWYIFLPIAIIGFIVAILIWLAD